MQSTQHVLRLEFPATGLGPYIFCHGSHEDARQPPMNCGCGRMPLHEWDRESRDVRPYKFGFVSAEQANRWWDDTAKESAHTQGYKLAVYEVPSEHVHPDENQCVFVPEVAKLVAHIDPLEWLTGDLNMILKARLANANA